MGNCRLGARPELSGPSFLSLIDPSVPLAEDCVLLQSSDGLFRTERYDGRVVNWRREILGSQGIVLMRLSSERKTFESEIIACLFR